MQKNKNIFFKKEIRNTNWNKIEFLKQLDYWVSRGKYGLEKDGRIWIYNTLEDWAKQLKCSKSTTQRVIRSLKEQGIIDSAYLSYNKRDRTLFYAINYDKLQNLNLFRDMVKKSVKNRESEHMVDHMYYKENNNKINKSYKSTDNFSKKSLEISENVLPNSKPTSTEKPKNTTVQDMLKVFNEEFSDSKVKLDKNLARNLVAAFKLKFENTLEKWRNFLKLIKTSNYLMSEKFKLTLQWMLKFATIDRLRLGELGVKIKEFFTLVSDDEWQSRAEQQISETDESEEIKNLRKKISDRISPAKYMAWFKNVKFLQKDGTIELIYPNKFIEDTIKTKFGSVASRTFSDVDTQIVNALLRWGYKRHCRKGKRWIVSKYFRQIKGDRWRFHCKTKDKEGHNKTLLLRRARNTRIWRHTKIRAESTPFNPKFKEYLEKRKKERKMQTAFLRLSEDAGWLT